MAERRKALNGVMVLAGLALAGLLILRFASTNGIFPFSYTDARTPSELLKFLESRTAHVKGIRVNGHLLEIGKRPSLQVLKGYDQVLYQVRPYRQVNYKYRNFTMAEVMDFCTNVTGESFDNLRSSMDSGKGYTPIWKGKIKGGDITLVRVTRFSYLVAGLADKPLFMGQVELAKRLGMNDATVLQLLLPDQDRWLESFKAAPSMDTTYPVEFSRKDRDELIAWLGGPTE